MFVCKVNAVDSAQCSPLLCVVCGMRNYLGEIRSIGCLIYIIEIRYLAWHPP